MDPRQSSNQPPEKSRMPAAAPQVYQHNPAGYPPSIIIQPVPPRIYPEPFVRTVQPAVFVTAAPLTNPVPDYLRYSIFTMLCCCLPLGIAALIYSIFTRQANNLGQREIAEKNSKMARTLNYIGLGIGLAFIVVIIIIQIVAWTR